MVLLFGPFQIYKHIRCKALEWCWNLVIGSCFSALLCLDCPSTTVWVVARTVEAILMRNRCRHLVFFFITLAPSFVATSEREL
jgi:hypothetical protein